MPREVMPSCGLGTLSGRCGRDVPGFAASPDGYVARNAVHDVRPTSGSDRTPTAGGFIR